jgi:hypothetical protein
LAALAVPPGHETLQSEDEDLPESAADLWCLAECHALLFHLEFVPPAVAERMCGLAPAFRSGPEARDGTVRWSNHCSACGLAIDDEDLFCEPGGAFFPAAEAPARLIRLLPVEEPLAAPAGGYAPEPAFFQCMSRG